MATAAELLRRGLRDHRRALAGWCGGIVAYSALIAAIFPSIEGSADFTKLLESYPDALKSLFGLSGGGDIGTGSGFVDAELFSFMLPLLAIVLSVGSAARTLAGEEDAGRLELVLAYPVRRRDAVLAKGAAVGLDVAALCAAGSRWPWRRGDPGGRWRSGSPPLRPRAATSSAACRSSPAG